MKLNYLILLIFLILKLNVLGQKVLSEEKDIFKEAQKKYFAQNYEEAVNLFSHLTSLKPKNTTYNYFLGVCFLNTKADKIKAINYLEFAVKDPKTPTDIYFYLGKAYHLANRFDDAINAYQKYQTLINKNDSRHLFIKRQIEMCNNGKFMLQHHLDVKLNAKKEINKAPAYGHYDLSSLGGKIITTPEHYKSNIDRKNDLNTVLYIAYNKDKLFFASQQEKGLGGKDIYIVKKLPTNEWALPQIMDSTINTPYDEDNPFLHPDGKTLYFSSKGHNSMGGYDIFKSELVEEEWPKQEYWSKPENIGYPINSSDDDQFFIADFDHEYAYFSSGRETSPGKMEVYKIKLPMKSIPSTVIKGMLTLNNVDNKQAKITLFDEETKEITGVFTTNPVTGEYLITAPPGKKYGFLIESEGMVPRIQDIYVPPQTEFYTLYQEIKMNKDEATEEITFLNDFTNPVEKEISEELAYTEYQANAVQEIKNTYQVNEEEKLHTVEVGNRKVYVVPNSNSSFAKFLKEEVTLASKTEKQHLSTEISPSESIISSSKEKGTLTKSEEGNSQAELQNEAFAKETNSKDVENVSNVESSGSEEVATKPMTEKEIEEFSTQVIDAFSTCLKNLAEQKNTEAEMALANAEESKLIALEKSAAAEQLLNEAGTTVNKEQKEKLIEEATQLQEEVKEKQQEVQTSINYANELKQEATDMTSRSNELMVKSDELQINKKDKKRKPDKESKNENYQIAYHQAIKYIKELRKESKEKSEKARIALAYSNKQKEIAITKNEEAQRIFEELNRIDDKELQSETAQQQKTKAENIESEAKELLTEVQAALDYSNELQASSIQKNEEAQLIQKKANQLAKQTSITEQVSSESEIASKKKKQGESPKIIAKTESAPVNEEPIDYQLAYAKEVQYVTKEKKDKKEAIAAVEEKQPAQKNVKDKKKTNKKPVAQKSLTKEEPITKETEPVLVLNDQNKNEQNGVGKTNSEKTKKGERNTVAKEKKPSKKSKQVETTSPENKVNPEESVNAKEEATSKVKTETNNESEPAFALNEKNTQDKSQSVISDNTKTPSIKTKSKKEKPLNVEENNIVETLPINSEPTKTGLGEFETNEEVVSRQQESTQPQESVSRESIENNKTATTNERATQQEQTKELITSNYSTINTKKEPMPDNEKNKTETQPLKSNNDKITAYGKAEEESTDMRLSNKNSSGEKSEPVITKQSQENNQFTAQEKDGNQSFAQEPTEEMSPNSNIVESRVDTSQKGVVIKYETERYDYTTIETKKPLINVDANQKTQKDRKAKKQKDKKEDELLASNKSSGSNAQLTPAIKYQAAKPSIPWTEKTLTLAAKQHVKEKLFTFEILPKVAYSKENPIPVDINIPEGLVFKVQIGAFRNPIPQELFGGLNPLTGENTDLGFTRYTVGLFRTYASANMVKNKVSSMGYNDAFVVAYYNGERIPLVKAMTLLSESSSEDQEAYKEIVAQETKVLGKLNISEKNFGGEDLIPINQDLPKGICYKIQIGAFSKPVSTTLFPKFDQLNGESSKNGLVRYTAGFFKEFNSALRYKDEIIIAYVRDAFIVAYNDGIRISIDEALATSGEVSTRLTAYKDKIPAETKSDISKFTTDDSKTPIFKVQIGAYQDHMPESFRNMTQNRQDITTETNANIYTRYFAGSFSDYQSAAQLRDEFRKIGIKDAFVTSYYKGKRISIAEASELLNK